MLLSELKTKIESTPLPEREIIGCWTKESKKMRLDKIDEMLKLLGYHEIPGNDAEYADLMDSILSEPSNDDAWKQMDLGRTILGLVHIHA